MSKMSLENSYFELHRDAVHQALNSQDLKRWWVAEQVGVHKTTLRRWLSGKITKVRSSHAEELARVLTLDLNKIAQPTTPPGLPN
jgi:hypothetical protein